MTPLAPPRTDFLGAGLLFGYTYVNVAAHSDWAGPWFTTELPAGRDDPFDAALDVDCAYEQAIEVAKQFVDGFTFSFGRATGRWQ